MAELRDRVKDQTNTTGTGTVTVDGVAPTGYRTMAAAHTSGATVHYVIVDSTGANWEVGEGVFSSTTLTRATVFASSNSGSLVSFASGAKTIFTGPVGADVREQYLTVTADGSGVCTLDMSKANYFLYTATANTTFSKANLPPSGQVASFILEITNGGAYTMSFSSVGTIKWEGSVVPLLSVSGTDVLSFYSVDGGTNWRGFLMGKGMA